ncbi:MAG: hypothetical protein F4Y00_06700 [Bacteroidetes bacterium SB0662_bin_6]|nr:hypothetical protein [Bacteroidetes bacterium SB0668_bin_1]MYE04640.1 hypothetical protein [Bacteroidetes bacterium SB0662_bin_6]
MTTYETQRLLFKQLKRDCSDLSVREYEQAVSVLVQRYNTTIHENRFVVGGAVEFLTYAFLRSAGIECTHRETEHGLILPDGNKISVNGVFQGGAQNVTLMNKRGTGERSWLIPRLFVVSGVGIVYGDQYMVKSVYIHDAGDSIELKKSGLEELISIPDNVLTMNISPKPPTEVADSSLTAGTSVARDILSETQSQMLLQAIR